MRKTFQNESPKVRKAAQFFAQLSQAERQSRPAVPLLRAKFDLTSKQATLAIAEAVFIRQEVAK